MNPDDVESSKLSLLVIAGVMALLVARWMLPAEASVDGETLWIVQGWLALAVAWSWDCYRRRQPLVRCDALTLAVCLIVVGHIASGLGVFWHGGDKRAAMNVMWEWVSLGVTFLIVRSYCGHPRFARRMLWGLTAVAVALAGLGLYQHYVWFPQVRGKYEQLKKELETHLEKGRYGTDAELRARQRQDLVLQRELQKFGVPMDDAARQAWERRLYSDEPFGPFALTNTFAGLLAAFLFIAMGAFMASVNRKGSGISLLGAGLAITVILWCLLLTKSRTAWVGGLCGIVCWLTMRGTAITRRSFVWVAAAVAVVAAIIVGVAVSGGLDRETLSESPKSIQYRFEYWTATADVLREFPWLGPGPGNFRARYLHYKLPGASEEIRDPHNLLLDLWCSGGLTALLGFILLLIVVVRSIVRLRDRSEQPEPEDRPVAGEATPWAAGVVLGMLMIAGISWFFDDGLVGRHLSVLAGSVVALVLLPGGARRSILSVPAVVAALLALLVHLTGAGGIEMPAITQVVLLLAVLIVDPLPDANSEENEPLRQRSTATKRTQSRGDSSSPSGNPLASIGASCVAMILFGACLTSATLPVMTRNRAVAEAGYVQMNQRDFSRAAGFLKEAAAADPFSPQPLHRLAMLTYARHRTHPQESGLLERAIEQQKLAIEQDPHHYAGYLRLGRWLAERYDRTGDAGDRDASIAAFEHAVERYPHNARLLAEFAKTLHCAGERQRAVARAEEARNLDDRNRRAGHRDKYLPDEYRKRLEAIAAGTAKYPCGERPAAK